MTVIKQGQRYSAGASLMYTKSCCVATILAPANMLPMNLHSLGPLLPVTLSEDRGPRIGMLSFPKHSHFAAEHHQCDSLVSLSLFNSGLPNIMQHVGKIHRVCTCVCFCTPVGILSPPASIMESQISMCREVKLHCIRDTCPDPKQEKFGLQTAWCEVSIKKGRETERVKLDSLGTGWAQATREGNEPENVTGREQRVLTSSKKNPAARCWGETDVKSPGKGDKDPVWGLLLTICSLCLASA